ncbi:hypothetical protein WN48_07199 [Eufriesea mexicana]|uniref:Uncharacterized protein n=1 Tax=Eufriesea mexicana TaxID=516756 RepID=A0A310SU12_9HYME|nr:hypothetical protein WN48_07199 [Eufriesea mexicana]
MHYTFDIRWSFDATRAVNCQGRFLQELNSRIVECGTREEVGEAGSRRSPVCLHLTWKVQVRNEWNSAVLRDACDEIDHARRRSITVESQKWWMVVCTEV